MAKVEKPIHSPIEDRRDRARRTTEEAMSIIDSERDAMRKKTARLRKLRLARESDETAAAVAAQPKKKTKAKPLRPGKVTQ